MITLKNIFLKWKVLIKIVIVLGMAIALNGTFIPKLFDWSSVTSLQQDEKFMMSDFYNRLAARRDIKYDSGDIVCIQCESLERDTISQLISLLADTNVVNPAVVGLDMYFAKKQLPETDARLITSLRSLGDRLVLPISIVNGNDGLFNLQELSFKELVEQLPLARRAAVNLPGKLFVNIQRTYRPVFPLENGDSVASMAGELLRVISPDDYDYTVSNPKYAQEFNICYPFLDIRHIPDTLFLEVARQSNLNEELRELIPDGAAVLVGAFNDMNDIYQIPTGETMSGVMVHAHAVSTMLNHQFINLSSNTINWLIALLFSLMYVSVMLLASAGRFGPAGTGMIRISAGIMIGLMLILGSYIFVWTSAHPYAVGFDKAMTMLVLTMFVYAMYGVVEWIIISIRLRIRKNKDSEIIKTK